MPADLLNQSIVSAVGFAQRHGKTFQLVFTKCTHNLHVRKPFAACLEARLASQIAVDARKNLRSPVREFQQISSITWLPPAAVCGCFWSGRHEIQSGLRR